jgi:threonine/homoserine/homoserine lactone efflux protein
MRELAAFLGVSALVIVTPGQDTALTIRNTLLGGRPGGVFTALGVSTGQAIWTLATSLGIGALLVASEPAFFAARLAGSAYLVFLGLQALRGAVRMRGRPRYATGEGAGLRITPAAALRDGLVSNLGNPKMLAFFTSLLPQFGDSFLTLLALGLAFCSLTLVWLTAYTLAVARAQGIWRRAGIRRSFEALTGTVLVGLGIRLALERR